MKARTLVFHRWLAACVLLAVAPSLRAGPVTHDSVEWMTCHAQLVIDTFNLEPLPP